LLDSLLQEICFPRLKWIVRPSRLSVRDRHRCKSRSVFLLQQVRLSRHTAMPRTRNWPLSRLGRPWRPGPLSPLTCRPIRPRTHTLVRRRPLRPTATSRLNSRPPASRPLNQTSTSNLNRRPPSTSPLWAQPRLEHGELSNRSVWPRMP